MSKLSTLASRIKSLESEVKRLKPQSAPGMLTTRTTRGTTRRAAGKQRTTNNDDTAPRWA